MKRDNRATFLFASLILILLACNLPSSPLTTTPAPKVATDPAAETLPPPETATASVIHAVTPASNVSGNLIYDVESSGTAAEKRAPYGDSYDIDRLERPFLKDMTYVPDLDIVNFNVGQDADWFYVSIKLIGTDPNNSLGINYGIELDMDHDGFGDYVIVAGPSYQTAWDTSVVRIFQDVNHDTAGKSPEKSDAPITTDGYETQIFHGGAGDSDPDMAWVRLSPDSNATLEFAFKKSWSGAVFMIGVFADAGLKDVGKLDYVDRFTEPEAGSPIKDKKYYPLGALFAVDNTCQAAFGFKPTGYEPKLCPPYVPPTKQAEPPPGITPPPSCPPAQCTYGQLPYPDCRCVIG